jgi:hypothetical protein
MAIARQFVKKFAFWIVTLMALSSALFWGTRIILQIDSQFAAAASTTRDLGIYAQRISNYANRLQLSKNAQVFEANQQMLRSLVRKMEIKHLSLKRGNPRFVDNSLFATEIKAIYYAMPTNLVNQIGEFLEQANVLTTISYKTFSEDLPAIKEVKNAANMGLVPAVSHIIAIYETESEARVSKTVFLLIASILGILVLAVAAYLFIFDNAIMETKETVVLPQKRRLDTVLNGAAVFSAKHSDEMELKHKEKATKKIH